jgi:peroxiredoxin
VEALGLGFPVLYDPGRTIINDYEVFNLNGTGRTTPSTFIVDKEGNIRWKYIGRNYTDRPSNGRIIEELDKLN